MSKEKDFECKPNCKSQYFDMVVISCRDYIKHISALLTKNQREEISKIIDPNF